MNLSEFKRYQMKFAIADGRDPCCVGRICGSTVVIYYLGHSCIHKVVDGLVMGNRTHGQEEPSFRSLRLPTRDEFVKMRPEEMEFGDKTQEASVGGYAKLRDDSFEATRRVLWPDDDE